MRFHYLDPGLKSELGHHANSCRLITGALRDRGIATSIRAFLDIEPKLRDELGAQPHFRHFTYRHFDRDPICGWLTGFHGGAESTRQDLAKLAIAKDDIVYLNSAQPAQLMAIVQWLAGMPETALPTVIMEFGTEPGLETRIEDGALRLATKDPREDPRAPLFRFAALQIPPALGRRLRLMTFDRASSEVYAMLLGRPVGTLPLPHHAVTSRRSRVGQRPVTIAVLGHQRPDKGYALVPEIARILLRSRTDLRLLIHNGAPEAMPAVQQAVRELAGGEPRIAVDERVAGPQSWAELLERSDLILCPYQPQRFVASYSAVVAEALANAIPSVVPEATSLAKLVAEFGGPGVTFAGFDAAAIAAAALRALDGFDRYAQLALAASERWQRMCGPDRLAAALLAAAGR
ncbi:MAG: glycosyltransferase [Alphaproteobacteria bacterium]|nr:glycosyltransferase [Alphaproteobacteria bacterium]